MYTIVVTGSRIWHEREPVVEALIPVFRKHGENVLLRHGGARGADHLADQVARGFGWIIQVYYADWDTYGKAAGIRRNEEMIRDGADLVVAFWKDRSPGTLNCINAAYRAGIEVQIIEG